MEARDFARQVESLAALEEPVRRMLYLHVVSRGGDVSRDDAARAVRVSRALAAFHLDKLVEAGLLEATFRRLSSRSGPGAGRPSKLYRRSPARIELSLPERRYELAAQMLATAVGDTEAGNGAEALRRAARDRGRRMGEELAPGSATRSPLERAVRALTSCGFEPHRTAEGEVVLRNCPFDSLRADSLRRDRRELVCGMNLALIEGLIEGLGLGTVRGRLAPRDGHCCVVLNAEPASE